MNKKNVKILIPHILIISFIIALLPNVYASAAATEAPAKPSISHNQYTGDVDGNYDISVTMWYGNNCTSYVLYEKFTKEGEYKAIKTDTLQDATPNAQNFNIEIRNRTEKGKYYYYIEFVNQYGKTKSDEIYVPVGIVEEPKHKIEIGDIDGDGTVNQFTVKQGTFSYKITNTISADSTFSVISSNKSSVKASIESGNILKITGLASGRSGLKIIDNKTGLTRNVGVRVCNIDGTIPGMPNYLQVGQVSEDTPGDLAFWQDISDTGTNKRCDIRYIYINGGPLSGWTSWNPTDPGSRVSTFIKESQKLGMIPYFVFYNIPDSAEDYGRDLQHVNDKSYMEAYYKNLKFFIDTCKETAGDDPVGIVLEPDFLGYMMQQNGNNPTKIVANGVEGVYSSGIVDKSKEPTFPNTIEGVVKSINYIIAREYPTCTFGWQFNTWGYTGAGTPSQGLMHATDFQGLEKGREFIKNAAKATAQYYMDAGILSYGADFISIDKYGLDGGAESGASSNPQNTNWFWNADLWNNYLLYTKTLHEYTKKPVTLWQLPVGHINGSQEISPYTNTTFKDLDNSEKKYEDSAPTFFFGDTFKAGGGNRFNHFSTNLSNDLKVKNNGDTITYGSHMEDAKNAGVTTMLFGAGVGNSTDAVGSPPTEDYWWISKLQKYYDNPVMLDNNIVIEIPEDLNNDGVVNELDLAFLSTLYNTQKGDSNWLEKADINKDNIIDIYDLVRVASKF